MSRAGGRGAREYLIGRTRDRRIRCHERPENRAAHRPGCEFGYPIARLDMPLWLRLGRGVYGGAARIDDTVDVHVLDWEGGLDGEGVEVAVFGKLRDERRCDSVDALRAQNAADCTTLASKAAVREWLLV